MSTNLLNIDETKYPHMYSVLKARLLGIYEGMPAEFEEKPIVALHPSWEPFLDDLEVFYTERTEFPIDEDGYRCYYELPVEQRHLLRSYPCTDAFGGLPDELYLDAPKPRTLIVKLTTYLDDADALYTKAHLGSSIADRLCDEESSIPQFFDGYGDLDIISIDVSIEEP